MNNWLPPARRNRLAATVPTVLLALQLAACAVDTDAELQQAAASYAAGELRTAVIHANNVLQEEPEHVAGRALRGRIFLAAGDPARARDELQRAAAAGADVAVPLADALLQLGLHEEALALLEQAPEAARDGNFVGLLGEALLAAGRLDEAAATLRPNAAPEPTSRLLLARARLAQTQGDSVAAERLYTAAVDESLAPHERIEALVARGEHRLRAERFADAVEDLAAAADLATMSGPRHVAVLALLVQLNVALNDLGAATEWAQALAERAPETLATNYAQALVAYENGQLGEAVARLQAAANQAPDNPLVNTLLGAAHLGKGDVFQAEQRLLRVLALNPEDPAALKLLAETRLRQQRPQAALDVLRPLTGVGSDPQLEALQGIASLQAGDVEQGILYLEQAVAGAPANYALRLELARAYIVAGRSDDAIALFENVSSADATLAGRIMRVLADVQAGDREGARSRAAEILEAFPADAPSRTAVAGLHQLLGDRDRALELLGEAVELDATYVPARMLLAGLLNDAGRANEAERQLRQVLELQPENATALAGLAQVALSQGDADEAEALLTRAVSAAPSVPLRLALARMRLARGNLDGAKEQIDLAAAASPSDPLVAGARGLHALASGHATEAAALLATAQAALPSRLDLAFALAEAQAASGDERASRDTLHRAVQAAPDALQLRVALGTAELRLGDTAAALEIAKDVQVGFPQQASGYLLEAQVRVAQRRYDQAVEYYTLGFERARSWEVLGQLITALQLAERPAQAQAVLEEWLAESPDHVPARLVLADFLQQAEGRESEALAEYERVLAVAPDNVVALNNAAWLRHLSSVPNALDLARRAKELAPQNPAVLDTLGWILTRQGDVAEGSGFLEQAASAAPAVAEIQYHYAYALAALGRSQAARDVLEPLLGRGDSFPSRSEAEALFRSL